MPVSNIVKEMLDHKTDYENFHAQCPECNKWNIFNRITDLKKIAPIFGQNIDCLHCGNQFRILGDNINLGYQKLIYDSYQLIQNKQYMHVIINLCMAYEMFFNTYLYINLAVTPLRALGRYDRYKKNNDLRVLLNSKIEKFTYYTMLNQFVKLVIHQETNPILTLTDAEAYINSISRNDNPSIDDIKNNITKTQLKGHLLALKLMCESKNNSINHIRNKVAHKQGYRPSLEEAERELYNSRMLIFGLTGIFGIITDEF